MGGWTDTVNTPWNNRIHKLSLKNNCEQNNDRPENVDFLPSSDLSYWLPTAAWLLTIVNNTHQCAFFLNLDLLFLPLLRKNSLATTATGNGPTAVGWLSHFLMNSSRNCETNHLKLIINIALKRRPALMGFKASCPPGVRYWSGSWGLWVRIWLVSRVTAEAPVDRWHSWTVTCFRNESVHPAGPPCTKLT